MWGLRELRELRDLRELRELRELLSPNNVGFIDGKGKHRGLPLPGYGELYCSKIKKQPFLNLRPTTAPFATALLLLHYRFTTALPFPRMSVL